MWTLRDSNPRPFRCKRNALTAELSVHVDLVRLLPIVRGTGVEPACPFERYHLKVVRLPFRHPRGKTKREP